MSKFRWETELSQTYVGDIPKDWEFPKFEKIVLKARNGGTPSTKEKSYWNGDIPWVTSNHLEDVFVSSGERFVTTKAIEENRTAVAEKGAILVATRVGIGKASIAKCELSFNQDITAIQIDNELAQSEYIARVLRSDTYGDVLESTSSGTTVDGILREDLLSVGIPLPRRSEQERIAKVLSWFDDLLENKEKQNAILEKTAIALFKRWFIDFEPFKIEGFVLQEFGKTPNGWKFRPIGEIAEIRNGLSYNGKEKFEEQICGSYVFITLANAREGGGFNAVYSWVKSDRLRERHFLKEGDLILTNTHFGVGGSATGRLLATPALVIFPPEYGYTKGVYSHHLTRIRPYNPDYVFYLYIFLKITRADSVTFATGTGVLGLDLNNFKKNKMIICPPDYILENFVNLIKPIFTKIAINQKEIMVLNKIRETISPLLVFGRLRVEEN